MDHASATTTEDTHFHSLRIDFLGDLNDLLEVQVLERRSHHPYRIIHRLIYLSKTVELRFCKKIQYRRPLLNPQWMG